MIERFKPHAKKISIFGTLLAFLGVGAFWLNHTNYPRMIQNRYFQGPITSYMGVNIGDTRSDVFYKIGKPNFVLGPLRACETLDFCRSVYSTDSDPDYNDGFAPETKKDFREFDGYVYQKNISNKNKEVTVLFKDSKVIQVHCRNDCENILGIKLKTKEADVYKILGKPDFEKIDDNFGNKNMKYKRFNLVLMLEKQEVYMLSVEEI